MRKETIQTILERNPNAFRPKISNVAVQPTPVASQSVIQNYSIGSTNALDVASGKHAKVNKIILNLIFIRVVPVKNQVVSKNIVSASKQEYSVVKIASATNAKTLMVLLIEESY